MAGEMAAVDSYGTTNATTMSPDTWDRGYLDAMQRDMGFTQIIAAPLQLLLTPDGVPFGYVNSPPGWDAPTQGVPPGSSVQYDPNTGVSIIRDGQGREIGEMSAPLQIGLMEAVPIAKFTYDFLGSHMMFGIMYPIMRPCQRHLMTIQALRINKIGGVAVTQWAEIAGKNYGGPDGGPSNR